MLSGDRLRSLVAYLKQAVRLEHLNNINEGFAIDTVRYGVKALGGGFVLTLLFLRLMVLPHTDRRSTVSSPRSVRS